MNFNSFEFLFVFLPVTYVLFHLLYDRMFVAAKVVLLLASLTFYAWWNPPYVFLILGSIAGNYAIVRLIEGQRSEVTRRTFLIVGIAANILVLCYFKYADFFIKSMNGVLATDWPVWRVLLPIGISFFSFTQIWFLVEVYRRKQRVPVPLDYALFVSFFPHLIAGPILEFREVDNLFQHRVRDEFWIDLAIGTSAIAIGLLKKTYGDVIGDFVQPAFAAAREGQSLTLIEAWSAALCFGVQIYLDFSGYTDMAIGLARLFQVRFPTNFYSPYKAASIIEFWHRWHTTLSRFLRDALYRPLGGNRNGLFRRDFNLMLTMLLGGLWHGANWTFVAWGGLHGAFLVFNHRLRDATGQPSGRRAARVAGVVVTFIAVTFAWVLFRAETFSTAFVFFKAMLGMTGISLPADYAPKLGGLVRYLRAAGIDFAPMPFWAGRDVMQWLVPALLVIFLCPNTTQIFERYKVATVPLSVNPANAIASEGLLSGLLRWQPTLFWRVVVACTLVAGLMMLFAGGSDEFIYFQF